MRYLLGTGPKPGTYTLVQSGGYPTLGGMMTWSVNWDAAASCNNSSWQFAQNFQRIFGIVMPVELVAFSAEKDGLNNIVLNWEVQNEYLMDSYTVQHSPDAQEWNDLKILSAKGANHYSFRDTDKEHGVHYYRLKMKELEGTESFSKIVRIQIQEGIACTLYPNPTQGRVYFCKHEEIKHLLVFNTLGQQVSIQGDLQEGTFETDNLSEGIYLFVVQTEAGESFSQRFLVKR